MEDLEERRSVHSLHSLRSSRSHPAGITGTGGAPGLYAQTTLAANANLLALPSRNAIVGGAQLTDIKYIDEETAQQQNQQQNGDNDLLKSVNETRI